MIIRALRATDSIMEPSEYADSSLVISLMNFSQVLQVER